jgi:hypothetical protein
VTRRATFRFRRCVAQVTGVNLGAGFIEAEDADATIRDAAWSSAGKRWPDWRGYGSSLILRSRAWKRGSFLMGSKNT